MKASLMFFVIFFSVLLNQFVVAEPGFNGTAPGCGVSGCHTFQSGILTAIVQSNLQVKITLTGTTSNVAGELVDESGNVVAVINKTGSNPFTFTAPSAGTYKVNAGFKSPNRRWDSTSVSIVLSDIGSNLIESTPHSYQLYNNYPNPFNPSTKIFYSLPEKSHVMLKIYDMIGNEISELVNEDKSAGNYSIDFNASNLASGIYFYSLEAVSFANTNSGFKETKKMILTK